MAINDPFIGKRVLPTSALHRRVAAPDHVTMYLQNQAYHWALGIVLESSCRNPESLKLLAGCPCAPLLCCSSDPCSDPNTALSCPSFTDHEYMAYMFKYDTVHGTYEGKVCWSDHGALCRAEEDSSVQAYAGNLRPG